MLLKEYWLQPASSILRFALRVAIATSAAKIPNNTAEEPIVPKPNPPFSWVFVGKSPTVAPSGRVKIKAAQNNSTDENFVP